MNAVSVEQVEIAVGDLAAARERYVQLLGLLCEEGPGAARFTLDNTTLVLLSPAAPDAAGRRARARLQAEGEGMCGLVLGIANEAPAIDARGLPLAAVAADNRATAPRAPAALDGARVHALDHVVIHTAQPDAVIALYRDALQIRLALDREFPARNTRLLFFRLGGVTLEFAVSAGADPVRDRFYGLAYRVADAEAARARLSQAGFQPRAVRDGQKPGTRVFTLDADTHGVPTLLLSDRARPRPHKTAG